MMVNNTLLKAVFEMGTFEEKLQKMYKLNVMGAVFLMGSQLDKADGYFLKAKAVADDLGVRYSNLLANLGNLNSQRKKFDEACNFYKEAIRISPFRVENEAKEGAGSEGKIEFASDEKMKKLALTIDGFAATFNSKEAFIDCHTNLGFALLALEKPAEAFHFLQIALAESPNSKEIQVNVGNALRQTGRRDEAIAFVWKQIKEEMKRVNGSDYSPVIVDLAAAPKEIKQQQLRFNIVCVKWGTKYGADYVNKLFAGCKRHCSLPFDFHCLTEDGKDLNPAIKVIPLDTSFETWWTKANLFDGCLEVDHLNVYIDLDVVIVKNIDFLTDYKGSFALMRTDEIACETLNKGGYNSSIILFRGNNLGPIFQTLKDTQSAVKKVLFRFDYWLEMIVPGADFVQDIWPGKIVDYLSDSKEKISENAAIVVFPRKPKPHDYPAQWVAEHWVE